MKAVDASLLMLLKKSSQFIVPIYQRTYAWSENECAQLWRDLLRAGSSESLGAHFTGSVVHVERSLSALTEFEPNLIIDGQQRVTTVTLLLSALAERLEALPTDQQEPIDGFSPRKIRNRYLLNDDESDERQYKLILSQSDRDTLIAILQGVAPEPSGSARLVANYDYFRDRLADPRTDLAAVCRGLAKLVVVDVRLERGVDNPQLVFEAMNSTGKKLSQADLIRNFVLMDLAPKAQEKIYTGFWRPMEIEFGPAAYESRFDDFVRHYLTVVTGEIPRLDDIYDAFKSFAARFISAGQTIDELVLDVRDYSRRYCAIALGKEQDPLLRAAFKDLDQIKADVVYPFLLSTYTDYDAGTISRDDLLAIVDMVTSYVFRRAVGRIPTNSLNTTFATFHKAVRKDAYLDSVKAHFLGMKNYRAFPTDGEFIEALTTSDLYNFKRRSYFLRKMENHGRKEHVSIEDYTIEHILPQNENLSAAWRSALGEDWQHVQEKYLHTLGNLTLTGYNSEYSDHAFDVKRDMEGGFRDSPLRLNRGLGQLASWDEHALVERARRLAREAAQIWTRPTLDAAVLARFQEPRTETGFSIEDHPHLLSPARRELFDHLTSEVLALDPGVARYFRKLYVAFKAETNFLDVVPQVSRMRLSLNIPIESLEDERGIVEDVSGKGHWGNGPTEVSLNEGSDFTYVMGLVRQAFEYQLGEG
ncbi:DUF262 domain-containing protein [Oerskovia sp. Sa1BUA8]|uniref:DUF262 domain-containing protein n=1 Tax=Oerskovia douganii TaxID=2762210 RepID=A0A9D5UC39_9CELL|nr:DUF262 and DUF1524 domain-containing protein [Oerskovia douganii]MBE7702379.1 DUF262 domain-containing protein [Oerskovia douganii]